MKALKTLLLLFAAVFLITGCATKDFGKLVRNDEVKKTFESATVLPGHTYYFTGPEAKPDAIIALDNSFTLANKRNFWIKVDITETMLQSWNRVIDNILRVKRPYYGSRIITPDGREAGVWYSMFDYTVVKTPTPQEIIIYTPDAPVKSEIRLNRFDGSL
jgi:hypothetical protein